MIKWFKKNVISALESRGYKLSRNTVRTDSYLQLVRGLEHFDVNHDLIRAIETVTEQYDFFQDNAEKAASEFDFSRSFAEIKRNLILA